MDIVQIFGNLVSKGTERNMSLARGMLIAGFTFEQVRYRVAPDRRLPKSRQYATAISMDATLRAMKHPEHSAAMSLFTPTEPLQVAGIAPYSVECMSAYLTGAKCEQVLLEAGRQNGISDTECSYHRVFTSALDSGFMPPPKFVVYTNVACDGNMITFPHIQERFGLPGFLIDVPYERSEESVEIVTDQIREMCAFVEDQAGKPVSEEALSEMIARERKTGATLRRAYTKGAHKRLPAGMSVEMFPALIYHLILGSEQSLRYAELLEKDMENAPDCDGLRIVWMHLIPNMQPAVCEALNFTDRVHLTYVDVVGDNFTTEVDPAKPYDAMARRMVYSPYNGPVEGRVNQAVQAARATDADGIILFAQWGCKNTIGAAPRMKRMIEEEGFPCLILEGDGCDKTNASDGQTATRLNAFLEMLETRRAQGKTPGSAAAASVTPSLGLWADAKDVGAGRTAAQAAQAVEEASPSGAAGAAAQAEAQAGAEPATSAAGAGGRRAE